MLINDGYINYHYVLINYSNNLDNGNVATHHTTYRCEHCLNDRLQKKLFRHIKKCKNNETLIQEKIPKEVKHKLYF